MDYDDLFISSFLGGIAIIFIAVEVTLWRMENNSKFKYGQRFVEQLGKS